MDQFRFTSRPAGILLLLCCWRCIPSGAGAFRNSGPGTCTRRKFPRVCAYGGGYVIYFRHADTGPAYLEQGVDLKRCGPAQSQRQRPRRSEADRRAVQEAQNPGGRCTRQRVLPLQETADLAFGATSSNRCSPGQPFRRGGAAARTGDCRVEEMLAARRRRARIPCWSLTDTICGTGGLSSGHPGRGRDLQADGKVAMYWCAGVAPRVDGT